MTYEQFLYDWCIVIAVIVVIIFYRFWHRQQMRQMEGKEYEINQDEESRE